MNNKSVALFNPFLDTLGGGEVYTASVAKCFLEHGYSVDLFWKDNAIKTSLHDFLGIDLSRTTINPLGYRIFSAKGNFLNKIRITRGYDLVFFVSDGSIPLLFSRKNVLHFQIPFTRRGLSLLDRIKLRNIHEIICNSRFTKDVIDRVYGVRSTVIYPPLNIRTLQRKKEHIILSVGRFTTTLHNKRQDVLVEVFRQMIDAGLIGWELWLIGSTKQEGKALVDMLQARAQGYPIYVIQDISHEELEKEYARATFFWHAAGFGVDEKNNPEQTEHFGIATAEAMASGCVPFVVGKGGQPELVKHGENGYLWKSPESLKKLTLQLIRSPEKMKTLSTAARKASRKFSKDRFCQEFSRLLDL